MTMYNVKVPVVELVDAPAPEQAIKILTDRLRVAGFDTSYAVDGCDSDAFESEDQSPPEPAPQVPWWKRRLWW